MKKLVEVNTVAGRGSTGAIAEAIARVARESGEWEPWLAYGREPHREPSAANLVRIGSDWDMRWHGVESRLFDNHGLASRRATRKFLKELDRIGPEIVHLHNIHGYYLNYELLFEWLRVWGGPVVWTLHDIWPITGHCAYFGVEECGRWRTGCGGGKCPQLRTYPASLLTNRSAENWRRKAEAFCSLKNLTLIPVSDWLSGLLSESFLRETNRKVIHNGVDLKVFKPTESSKEEKPYVIAVSGVWNREKGFYDLLELRKILPRKIDIVVVGVTDKQKQTLPGGIRGVTRTESREELRKLYAGALAFVNPTYGDNFPTVNIEALACGTPVVTYRTGGSPEAVDELTGIVVERGDVEGLAAGIEAAAKLSRRDCRARAVSEFDAEKCYKKYLSLYEEKLGVVKS